MYDILSVVLPVSLLIGLVAFFVWRDLVRYLRPGYVRVKIRRPDRTWYQEYIKIKRNKEGQPVIKVGRHTYGVDDACMDIDGRWRTSTLHYKEGVLQPINYNDEVVGFSKGIASVDHQEAMENHVGRDIIRALDEDGLTTSQSVMLVLIVLAVGFGGLFAFQYKSGKDLETRLAGIESRIGVRSDLPPVDFPPGYEPPIDTPTTPQ